MGCSTCGNKYPGLKKPKHTPLGTPPVNSVQHPKVPTAISPPIGKSPLRRTHGIIPRSDKMPLLINPSDESKE